MLVQHVQHGYSHGNDGTEHSMWSSSSESGIFSAKYGIVEFSFQLSCWSEMLNSRCHRSWGFKCVMYLDCFGRYL